MFFNNLYSDRKRKKSENNSTLNNSMTENVRISIYHCIMNYNQYFNSLVSEIKSSVIKRRGILMYDTPSQKLLTFLKNDETDDVLDIIEISSKVIRLHDGEHTIQRAFEDEINAIFEYHNIGYKITDTEIREIGSKFIEENAIAPAIELLENNSFRSALEEFQKAIEHHRK